MISLSSRVLNLDFFFGIVQIQRNSFKPKNLSQTKELVSNQRNVLQPNIFQFFMLSPKLNGCESCLVTQTLPYNQRLYFVTLILRNQCDSIQNCQLKCSLIKSYQIVPTILHTFAFIVCIYILVCQLLFNLRLSIYFSDTIWIKWGARKSWMSRFLEEVNCKSQLNDVWVLRREPNQLQSRGLFLV